MPDHLAMTMPLMPAWGVAMAVVVLLVAGALHVSHAHSVPGYARWWHASHVSMGAGMVVMFLLPQHGSSGLYWVMAGAFGAHAVAMTLVLPWVSGLDRRVWAAATIDQLLMVYMLLPLAGRPAGLSYVAVAYLVAAAVAWLFVPEQFTCMTRSRGVPVPQRLAPSDLAAWAERPGGLPESNRAPGSNGALAVRTRPSTTSVAARRLSARVTSNLTAGVRLTLMAMTLAMAWMLLSMQLMGS